MRSARCPHIHLAQRIFVPAGTNTAKLQRFLQSWANLRLHYNQDGFINATDNRQFENDLAVNFTGFTPTI